jgi:hypothetical protein
MQQFLRTYRQSLPHDRRKRSMLPERTPAPQRSSASEASVSEPDLVPTGRDENDPLFLQFKEAEPSV